MEWKVFLLTKWYFPFVLEKVYFLSFFPIKFSEKRNFHFSLRRKFSMPGWDAGKESMALISRLAAAASSGNHSFTLLGWWISVCRKKKQCHFLKGSFFPIMLPPPNLSGEVGWVLSSTSTNSFSRNGNSLEKLVYFKIVQLLSAQANGFPFNLPKGALHTFFFSVLFGEMMVMGLK